MPWPQIALATTIGVVWAVVVLWATFSGRSEVIGLAQTITVPLGGVVAWFGVSSFRKAKDNGDKRDDEDA